jgi:hypothetical protein
VPEPDLVQIFAAPLHQSGARYLVAGSVGAKLRRRGLLEHFRTMSGNSNFV